MSASLASALIRRPEPAVRTADPRTARARTMLCAIALGLSPILLVLAALIEVDTSDNAAKAVAQIAADRNRFLVGNLLFALGVAALVPGALALATLVRARGAAWMTTGACMMALGGGSMAIGIWTYTAVGYLGTENGIDRGAMVSLLHKGNNSPVTGLAWLIGTGALIGMILAAVGLIRARAVPLWQPILLIIGPVLLFTSNGGGVAALLTLPLAIALIALAFEVVRGMRTSAAAPTIDLTVADMPTPRHGAEATADGARPTTTLG